MRKLNIDVLRLGLFLSITISMPFFVEAQVRINEIVTSNSIGLVDEDGDYPDWIELFNAGSEDVNLSGWTITDDKTNITQWVFPDVTIFAGGYLVLFASGKDRKQGELHTNFKLSKNGEFLGLFDPTGQEAGVFDPLWDFPADHSLAYFDGAYLSTSQTTPGSANIKGDQIGLPAPIFSHTAGFYNESISLELNTSVTGATIYYTTDASDPQISGVEYTKPISITTTTIVRAYVIESGNESASVTYSYIFPADVINQSNNPPGYPSMWGPYEAISGYAIGDYEMDPEITQDPKYEDKMLSALHSLPTVSLVTHKDNLFLDSTDPEKGGIYIYTGAPGKEIGKGWERPASIELFDKTGQREFQINCGVEIHGGHSRRPEKSPKHSFRVSFKSEYGPGRLNYPLFGEDAASDFNSFILRAGFNNSFVHHQHSQRQGAQLIRDLWVKDTQKLMGHSAGKGFLAHLYINGLYWGVYNPTERINEDFMESYFGGSPEDYDIMKDYSELVTGSRAIWDTLVDLTREGLTTTAAYRRVLGQNPDGTDSPFYPTFVDPVSLADYMIINMYAANRDWDHHNWIAAYNRQNLDQGYQFYCWDNEITFNYGDLYGNVTSENNIGSPSGVFQGMIQSNEFRELFEERIRLHCTAGGILTPDSAAARWSKMTSEVELAIIAESARWGDYRRDVHQYSGGPYEFYTPETFATARAYFLDEYFPSRTDIFLQQVENAGFLPEFQAPMLFINNAETTSNVFRKGDMMGLMANAGIIYYTLNGIDPINVGTAESLRYRSPLEITNSSHLVARAYDAGEWSTDLNLKYYIDMDRSALKITEIHYNPLDEGNIGGKEFEFLEIKNTGDEEIDLGGVVLKGGVFYEFPIGNAIAPGSFKVLASNSVQFENRYGFASDGMFSGSLSNSGEDIQLVDPLGSVLIDVDYFDSSPWPEEPDGDGYSLVSVFANPTGNQQSASDWISSRYPGGSPGADEDYLPQHIKDAIAIKIYPNPSDGKFLIDFLNFSGPEFEIRLFDVSGKRIEATITQIQPDKATIIIRSDFVGVCLMDIQIGDQVVRRKILVGSD